MRIETKRLLIRSFVISDVRAYAEIVADPRVTKFLADGAPHPYEEAEAYIRDCINRDRTTGISRYAVLRKRELDLFGFCGFKEQRAYVDFGWRYAYHAWGQGYATEAALRLLRYGVVELGLTNIAAGAFVENVASVRIIEKLGFNRIARDDFHGRPTIRYYQSAAARQATAD